MAARADLRPWFVIALGYVAGAGAYTDLPGRYLPPDPPLTLARPLIAFLLPTAAAIICVLLRRLWTRDLVRTPDAACEPIYRAIVFRIVLFVIALHGLVIVQLASVSGLAPWVQPWSARLVVVLLGMLFIGVGNLLPRTRPNLVIGIRTSRTLADRRVWLDVNRAAGYVAVGLGVAIALAALLPTRQMVAQGVSFSGAAALVVLVVYARRHVRV